MVGGDLWIGFTLLLLFLAQPAGADFPGQDVDDLIRTGLDLALQGQHEQALGVFAEVAKARPGHPGGHFYQAAAWERWIEDQQDYSAEDRFYALVDTAIVNGERMVADGTSDPWVYAFLGATYGLKGVYEAQRERWLPALRDGWRGVKNLKQSVSMDPNLYDAYVGMGTYLYWRSTLTKQIAGLPLVRDDRERAMGLLRTAAERSRYSKAGAKCQLLWILIKEGRFVEALEIGRDLYARYPTCSVVIFGYATALFRNGLLEEAESVYAEALRMYESRREAHPHAMECRWGLAKTYAERGQFLQAATACRRVLAEQDRAQADERWPNSKVRAVRRLLEQVQRERSDYPQGDNE